MEIILTYPTPEGSREIVVEGERTSFGRGSEADHRFDDDGLSRLNSTIYRDGERVWIVDENSTNGTFVNGQEVQGSGTPLRNGDAIKIGNYTNLTVRISTQTAKQTSADKPVKTVVATATSSETPSMLIPLVVTVVAILVIGVSAIVIGFKFFGNNSPEITYKESSEPTKKDVDDDEVKDDEKKSEKTPTPEKKPTESQPVGNVDIGNLTVPANSGPLIPLPSGKKVSKYVG